MAAPSLVSTLAWLKPSIPANPCPHSEKSRDESTPDYLWPTSGLSSAADLYQRQWEGEMHCGSRGRRQRDSGGKGLRHIWDASTFSREALTAWLRGWGFLLKRDIFLAQTGVGIVSIMHPAIPAKPSGPMITMLAALAIRKH